MAANKLGLEDGTRVAKCTPDYSSHFLPDLCSHYRVHFRFEFPTSKKFSSRDTTGWFKNTMKRFIFY